MELKMQPYTMPNIRFNAEEIKQYAMEVARQYTGLAYTEEQIQDAKKDRAKLNKLVQALDGKRKDVKKQYMEPYNAFEAEIKEIIGIVQEPMSLIDRQLADYEENRKAQKKETIEKIFDAAGFPEWVDLEQIWEPKWLNATVSIKTVETEIYDKKGRILADVEVINNLPSYNFEALDLYKMRLDLNVSIAEANRRADIERRKEEARQAAEKKRAEELRKEQEMKDVAIKDLAEAPRSVVCDQSTPAQPERQWVRFAAFITTDDALALKEFFNSRGIEFKSI